MQKNTKIFGSLKRAYDSSVRICYSVFPYKNDCISVMEDDYKFTFGVKDNIVLTDKVEVENLSDGFSYTILNVVF